MKKQLLAFYKWRLRNIQSRNFLFLVSILTGILAGLAAVSLKTGVHYIQTFLQEDFNIRYENYPYVLYPLAGILFTVLYAWAFHKGRLERGVSNILFTISKGSAKIQPSKMWSQVFSSAITVGFGGSAGLEAPIVVTGSAIGSNTGRLLKLNYKERVLLIACGAAAGISAIFNSPIAGVIFAVEVLLAEFTIPAFIPLLMASATASVVSKMLYSGQLFYLISDGYNLSAIPFYIIFGAIAGLMCVYITRVTIWIEKIFSIEKRIYLKAIAGGLLLGGLIFVLPPLYGEGYTTVEHLLEGNYSRLLDNSMFYQFKNNGWFLILFSGCIVLVKIVATSITIGAGGNGGIFAPSLFTGAMLGFFFTTIFKEAGIIDLNTSNFVAVGMAGILSGVVHAPLTSIFLIAEITGGYVLFVPLMIVSALSFLISRHFEPYSVYTKLLAERGQLPTNDKDKTVVSLLNVRKLLETNFSTVKPEHTLRELVQVIAHSKRNIFPVVDAEKKLAGILFLDDVREIMFDTDNYDKMTVADYMVQPQAIVDVNNDMKLVMEKFETNNIWNLPVTDNGRYIGFISKSNVFTQYRQMLIKQSNKAAE